MRMRSRLLLAGALALAAAPAAAQPAADPTARALADLRLATSVQVALATDVRTRALDVDVTARAGAVALAGRFSPTDREMAAAVARGVPGVQRVESGTASLPAPATEPLRAETPSEAPPETAPPPSEAAEAPVYHRVASGETLFSLARRYETTVEAVRTLNGLRDGSIRVGQRLRMR